MWFVFLSFLLTLLSLLLLLNTRLKALALDNPNHRSLHITITPRTGGLAVMFGILICWFLLNVDYQFLLSILALMAISLIDDIYGLKARWRFLAQLLVCGFFLIFHGSTIGWWLLPPMLLAMVWMTNLYNFMDGSDGLAGGMACIGFGAYALAAYLAGSYSIAMMCACISVSSLAFLCLNFPPAKIFMGDAGSIPLGFLVAALGFMGCEKHLWPIWFPAMVFSPFIVDASVTLIKRVARREKVWQAHREHYYQRLVQGGWGHRKTASAEYLLMVIVATHALFMLNNQSTSITVFELISWLIIYTLILRLIDSTFKLDKVDAANKLKS